MVDQSNMEKGLPTNYNWFSEQIAGHHPSVIKNGKREIGILKKAGSSKILKPKQDAKRGDCEENLYRILQKWRNSVSGEEDLTNGLKISYNEDIADLVKMTPAFFGTQRLIVDDEEREFLILDDVTSAYRYPAILDVKMGRVTFDPLANQAKREKESEKYLPQKTLGFRLLGYRVHVGDHVQVRDKEWGKELDELNVMEGLSEFFEAGRGRDSCLLKSVLEKLYEVKSFFERQRTFHFYASSLLFMYESDKSLPANVRIYMIDFSHVFPANGLLDENYMHGLDNIIEYIKELHCPTDKLYITQFN